MKTFQPITIDQALEKLIQASRNWQIQREIVPLAEAGGRFLGEDIFAPEDVPAFDRSLVDGYAIHSQSVLHASSIAPAILPLQARVDMGQPAPPLIPGAAVYVPTGGMLSEGANGVVMLEYARELGEDVLLHRSVHVGENCSFRGEDIKQGEHLLSVGSRLGRGELGVLAALSKAEVKVIKRPKIAIFSTGDELVDIAEDMSQGQIRDVNRYSLTQAVIEAGGEVVLTRILRDRLEDFLNALREAKDKADISLISGGSSVGTKDFTQQAIETLSGRDVLINGMLIKPGKPTLAGIADEHLIIGLPGHPVSAIRVFDALVEEYLRKHYGFELRQETVIAVTEQNFPSTPGQRTYHSVRLTSKGDDLFAQPLFSRSAWISELIRADGVVVMDEDIEGLEAGIKVGIERRR